MAHPDLGQAMNRVIPVLRRSSKDPDQVSTHSVLGILVRVIGLLALGLAIWILYDLPFARWPLVLGSVVYLGLLLWRPALWLILLPLLLPVLDLRPWTGRIYLDEFDALVLVTLAAYLLRGRYSPSFGTIGPISRLLFVLFVGLVGFSLFRSLYPWPSIDANSFSSYYSSFNALRVSKGLFWALLLYPAWVAEERLDVAAARRFLLLGATLAGIAVLSVVLWERGIYSTLFFWGNIYAPIRALLDFATPYRVTALFADMHLGGTAIDGWLLLTLPFAVMAFLTARGPLMAAVSGISVLGILYTAFVTFSRGVYLGIFIAILVTGLVLFMRSRSVFGVRVLGLKSLSALLVLTLITGSAYVAFRSGGSVSLAYSLGAFVSGAFLMMISTPLAWDRWRSVVMAILVVVLILLCRWTILDRQYGFLPLPPWIQAAFCILPAALAGLWTGRRMSGHLPLHQSLVILAVYAGFVFLLMLSLFGYRMDTRLADVSADLQHRIDHWKTAVSIMDRDFNTQLFGQGVGRFPQTYYLIHENAASAAGFRIEDEVLNRSLRLLGGPNIRVGQILSLAPGKTYRLAFSVRTDESAKPVNLHMRICHRHLVPAHGWNPTCRDLSQQLQATSGQWVTIGKIFESNALGSFRQSLEGFLTLEMANRSSGRWMDIDAISILDQSGREQVDNGNFEQGLDRWFMYSDFDHLPWHIKNLWVHVYFELGFVGGVLFGLIAMAALTVTARSAPRDPFAFALLVALGGFNAVGAFGTIIDSPRVALLYWLVTLLSLGTSRLGNARDSSPIPARKALPSRSV